MKNLILICFLFIGLSSQSQDKAKPDSTYKTINPNGSYALVEKRDGKTTSTTKFSVVNNGRTSVITNPDGSKSTMVNDVATGSIYAVDGSLSSNVRVITPAEAKVIEANAPKRFVVANADGSTTNGLNILSTKPVTTYSSTTTSTANDTREMTLAEKAMANYLPRPAIEHAIIANHSKSDLSEFWIDLYSGNKKFKKAADYIRLSVTTSSAKELSNGAYNYSDKDPNGRGASTFAGSVKTGNDDVEISGGSFTVAVQGKNMSIDYQFTLKNGKRVTGRYKGKFEAENPGTL